MKQGFVAWVVLLLSGLCLAAGPEASEPARSTLVLDTASGFWRVHYTLRPPVVRDGQELRNLTTQTGDTPGPPGEWVETDFDDGNWSRITGRPLPPQSARTGVDSFRSSGTIPEVADAGITGIEGSSPALALICMRGRFGVTDPAAVRDLKLSLVYRGGVVVYVNGKEVGRAHVAPGASGPDAPAQDYPKEAFLTPDGSPVMPSSTIWQPKDPAKLVSWKARVRTAAIPIPVGVLRKGANVLAVEVHRAPYLSDVKQWIVRKRPTWEIPGFLWATCNLHSMSLESSSPVGLTPNVARPRGLHVWNSQPMQPDFDMDYGDPYEPLRPVRLVGSRGGFFSGKVVVGNDRAIKGLRARITDLTGAKGAKIAASSVQVRYALPTGPRFAESVTANHYPAPAVLLDGLSDTPPDVVDVRAGKSSTWSFGAVCPVWVSVSVPGDAVPGNYAATLTIAAEGEKDVDVPVELKVCSWLVPNPGEFHTVVDIMQSPESVALQYNVPLYSDRHFQLLEKSLERAGHVGSWTLHIPLICRTNLGNEQSMVRWIRKPDGTYKYDFSVMDRYLDLAGKHMGKPRIVMIVVWDIFLGAISVQYPGKDRTADDDVPVSMLDEATGEVTMGTVGRYDEAGKARWKALTSEMMEHLKKRGLDKSVILGFAYDVCPSEEKANFWLEVMPGVAWGRYGHFNYPTFGHKAPVKIDFFAYCGCAVGCWGSKPMYGWKQPERVTAFVRLGTGRGDERDPSISIPWNLVRLFGELNIQGRQRGFGRIGLDFWPVLEDAKGEKRATIQGRYPQSNWKQIDMMLLCLVPPGPDGAMATGKLEMMREGLQETEARIFLESVLTDPVQLGKLPASLAARAQAVLDARVRALLPDMEQQTTAGFLNNPRPLLDGFGFNGLYTPLFSAVFQQWYMASGWQERSEQLFNVAAEVTAALR